MKMLSLCLTLLILSGCTSIAGNYPAKLYTNSILPSLKTYPNEILATEDFKISSGNWFELEKFQQKVAEKKEALRNMNAPVAMIEMFDTELKKNRPLEVKMASEVKKQKASFCALGFWINPKVNISVHRGGLILTLRDGQGNIVEVQDKGCLFLTEKHGRPIVYDSRNGQVNFNHNFNNRPDYKKIPNIVYVRLEQAYYKWEIIGLALDNDKIIVQKNTYLTR